jgi:hypothetical protein
MLFQPAGLVPSCSYQIADPVGHTRGQVSLKAAGQLEVSHRRGKFDESVMNGIFRDVDVVGESYRQDQQAVSVFFIDPAQTIPVALFASHQKQHILH